MPMYEYACETCGRPFEELRALSEDDADVTCPECGSGDVTRQLSTFASGTEAARGSGSCGGPRGFT